MEREAQCVAVGQGESAHLVPSLYPLPGAVPEEAAAQQQPEEAEQRQEGETDEAADPEERTPKAGRRRRRRRHRRGAGDKASAAQDSSDDESHPSQESGSSGVSAGAHRNVVTWSDLGGDSVLKKALPVGRVVHSAIPEPPQQPPQCASMPVAWEAPVAAMAAQAWPVGWTCTAGFVQPQGLQGVVAFPYTYIAPANARSPWTEKDSTELRQWLCTGFSGGMPGLPELTEALQSFSADVYED